MTTNADQLPVPVATPSRVGQATAVEQSRAVAEVQAAVVVAQQCPRSVTTARSDMKQSCQMLGLAERAFFRFPRGDKYVTGATVHLARELARCWGNIQFGLNELRRDDERHESEMMSWAWDVQTNARSSQIFIVPHKRDRTEGGPRALTAMRDIYENNANMGARRLREAIFSILPPWFTEEAKDICQATIRKGDGTPLPERIAGAIAAFEQIDVPVTRLEQKLGRPSGSWNQYDIAQLLVAHRSIERGELAVDDEFPAPRVSGAEIAAQAANTNGNGNGGTPAPTETAPAAGDEPPADQPEPEPDPEPDDPSTVARSMSGNELLALAKAADVALGTIVKTVQRELPDRAAVLTSRDKIAGDPTALAIALRLIEEKTAEASK